MIDYNNIVYYIEIYFLISIFFMIVNSTIAGFLGLSYNWSDVRDSILWPLSVSVLLGVTIRLIKERFFEE